MFRGKETDCIEFKLSTTRFLGKQDVAEQFIDLLFRYGGIYLPEKWDVDERACRSFEHANFSDVIEEWTLPKKIQTIFFHRRQPVEILMWLRLERFARAKFNDFTIYVRDKHFSSDEAVQEFLSFAIDLCSIFSADYGFIAHTIQERRQSPILTPAERLPGIYWANFFGSPYIKFFGREKLLATPCLDVREINKDLLLLLTSNSPFRSEMLNKDDEINRVKAYLDQHAFAGPHFPDEPCVVPQFDFSDVRPESEPSLTESPQEKLKRIRGELTAKGYRLIDQSPNQLTFQGEGHSTVLVNVETGEVELDITGEVNLQQQPKNQAEPS